MGVKELHDAQHELSMLTGTSFQETWQIVQERMRNSLDAVMLAANTDNPYSCVAAVSAYRNILADSKIVDTRIKRLEQTIKDEQRKITKAESEQTS